MYYLILFNNANLEKIRFLFIFIKYYKINSFPLASKPLAYFNCADKTFREVVIGGGGVAVVCAFVYLRQ